MSFRADAIIEAIERCGASWEALEGAEDYVRRWSSIYGQFYVPERRRLRGGRAQEEAQGLCSGEFLVIPCRDPSSGVWAAVGTGFRCRGKRLPDLTEASHYVDAFISPEDLSWTLLYGHEVDVFGGPDFSRADWIETSSPERQYKREWTASDGCP